MSNRRDFTKKNPQFTGTDAMLVPKGTTAERPGSAVTGYVRYNTDLGFLEQYNASGWAGIDAPPQIVSISPSTAPNIGDTVTITGANFKSGSTVKLVGTNLVEYSPASTSYVNSSTITFTTPTLSEAHEPYSVQVTNPSGLAYTLDAALGVGSAAAWNTASGSLATLYNGNRSSSNLPSLSATDPDGGTVSYAVTSGSLPTGISLNSNGTWTGTANAVGSNTTYSFQVTATDNPGGNASVRAFSITVNAPVVQSFTSGSGSFSVPTGVSSVEVLVVAAGAPGGNGNTNEGGGGGAAGGMVEAPSYPVTPGGTVSYSVGATINAPTGSGGQSPSGTNTAGNSTFGGITANGGGHGGYGQFGFNGGSGGGGSGFGSDWPAGSANQGPSGGGTGYGNPGGTGRWVGPPSQTGAGGGGGGAGGAGQAGPQGPTNDYQPGGSAGAGRANSITGSSVTYATGGRGGFGRARGGDGQGAPTGRQNGPNNSGNGGSGGNAPGIPGLGGPGVVIVRY